MGDTVPDRLRTARRARGMTQQAAAERLGLARTTLVAIERGERPIRSRELVALARVYGKQVNELLREAPEDEDFIAQFRLSPWQTQAGDDLTKAVEVLQGLADDYIDLELRMGAPLPQRYPPQVDVSGLPPESAGESQAETERNRLGLGDAPVHHLRQLLETDVGLRIFAMALPSRVAGLFAFSRPYGACIGMNAAHPGERQRWSLAHEYAHFLGERAKPEVTTLYGYRRVPRAERFADSFAAAFLLPATGLKRRYNALRQARRDGVTPADLLHLAELFEVSLEALVRRLEGLGLLRPHSWERLVKLGFRVGEARELLELAAVPPDDEILPLRFRYLALTAYLDGQISEGQYARLLRTDRASARKLASDLSRRVRLDTDGVVSGVQLGPDPSGLASDR
ncbi:MAG: helix-turn-helix domain-containing protein [Candidatus Dormibacteria bacterium]